MVFSIFFVLLPYIKVIAKEEKIAEIGVSESLVGCYISDFYARQEFVSTCSNVVTILLTKVL